MSVTFWTLIWPPCLVMISISPFSVCFTSVTLEFLSSSFPDENKANSAMSKRDDERHAYVEQIGNAGERVFVLSRGRAVGGDAMTMNKAHAHGFPFAARSNTLGMERQRLRIGAHPAFAGRGNQVGGNADGQPNDGRGKAP